jgi:hypothetical protein
MPQARYRCIVTAVSMTKDAQGAHLPSTEKTLRVAHGLAKRLVL